MDSVTTRELIGRNLTKLAIAENNILVSGAQRHEHSDSVTVVPIAIMADDGRTRFNWLRYPSMQVAKYGELRYQLPAAMPQLALD